MSSSKGCVSRTRSVVIWGSFVLGACGWVGAAWSWADHGYAAGVNPGFITALAVATTFSIALAVTAVMPDKARMYAMGFRDGVAARDELLNTPDPVQQRPRLELVGH